MDRQFVPPPQPCRATIFFRGNYRKTLDPTLAGPELNTKLHPHLNLPSVMAESAALPNQRPTSTPFVFVDNDSMDAHLDLLPAPRKIGHCCFPAQQEVQEPSNLGVHDLPNVQDVLRLIPGPHEVGATSENGDSANEQLLQNDQLDIEAVRTLLGLAVQNNVITVQHYWRVVKCLRDDLLQAGSYKMAHGEEYARVILRLAGRLTTLSSQQSCESDHCLRPPGHVECLGNLLEAMGEGFIVKQQIGTEEIVYIIKDRELYSESLCSVASCLRGGQL